MNPPEAFPERARTLAAGMPWRQFLPAHPAEELLPLMSAELRGIEKVRN